jgi:hypothetical protein
VIAYGQVLIVPRINQPFLFNDGGNDVAMSTSTIWFRVARAAGRRRAKPPLSTIREEIVFSPRFFVIAGSAT